MIKYRVKACRSLKAGRDSAVETEATDEDGKEAART